MISVIEHQVPSEHHVLLPSATCTGNFLPVLSYTKVCLQNKEVHNISNYFKSIPVYIWRCSVVTMVDALCWKCASNPGHDDAVLKVQSSLNILPPPPAGSAAMLMQECRAGPILRHARIADCPFFTCRALLKVPLGL